MNYNWDSIELDSTSNHNSRLFFGNQRRLKHEKIGFKSLDAEEFQTGQQIEISAEDIKQEIDLSSASPLGASNFEALKEQTDNAEIKLEEEQAENNEEENFLQQIDELAISDDGAKCMPQKFEENKENADAPSKANSAKMPKALLSIATPSRFYKFSNNAQKPQKKSSPFERLTAIPNKREMLLKKQMEEEKKMREFRSRPMPKFKEPVTKSAVHRVTLPETPAVAKRSKESRLKMKEKLQELEQQMKPVPFKAHAADVVKEAPFVPKTAPTVLVTKPYNLRSDRRLAERKKYDDAVQRAMDEKKKKEQEAQKKLDEERVKELRKATVFKARPNPFK